MLAERVSEARAILGFWSPFGKDPAALGGEAGIPWSVLQAFGPKPQAPAPVTRQMTSPTSSATSREPSGPMVTPTGRP